MTVYFKDFIKRVYLYMYGYSSFVWLNYIVAIGAIYQVQWQMQVTSATILAAIKKHQ